MPLMQELNHSQIRHSLDEAVRKATPVSVTCRRGRRWHNLRSRLLARTHDALWLQWPVSEPGGEADMAVGLDLGLSFKLKHHKHIFNLPLAATGEFQVAPGERLRAVRVPLPQRMQRVQRRAYLRAEVPRNRSVLATFRMGAADEVDPSSGAPPAWEGWVTNISAGGFQVRLTQRQVPELEVGDLVTVRIDLGQEYPPVVANAQFRQQHDDDRGVTCQGFQFVGLNESPGGREMLQRIGRIVCEFQRLQGRRRAGGAA